MSIGDKVILADGEFPTNSYAIKVLQNAPIIICTDGSANNFSSEVKVENLDQHNNDLEKAITFFLKKYPGENLTIIGASGLRDDQNLASLLILDKYSKYLSIVMLSNYFKIFINKGKNIYPCKPKQTISLLPLKIINNITTEGLKFNLTKDKLTPDSLGISNIALENQFMINSSENIFVFVEI
jgi:thiamine pyrophosphokinase